MAAKDKAPPSPAAEPAESELTRAQAAAEVGIPAEGVFAFRDYGTHVVVVTTAGLKLDSRDVEALK